MPKIFNVKRYNFVDMINELAFPKRGWGKHRERKKGIDRQSKSVGGKRGRHILNLCVKINYQLRYSNFSSTDIYSNFCG